MVKVVTNLQTLMILASNVGKAKKSGNISEMREAQEKLVAYEDLVRDSDEMNTNLTHGDL